MNYLGTLAGSSLGRLKREIFAYAYARAWRNVEIELVSYESLRRDDEIG